MRRELDDWIAGYHAYTNNSEPPLQYHTWLGLSMIAGAIQRKCYVTFNYGRIYCNMFVFLVGPSGKCRKGTAIRFGRNVINNIPSIQMIAQKTTEQQLIRDFKTARKTFHNNSTGLAENHSSMTAMLDELTVFLGTQNIDLLGLLTDMYDSGDSWSYRTKTSGKDRIMGLCLNFIAATAPDWLHTMIPMTARGGGFTSRIIFIVEFNKRKKIAMPMQTEEERVLEKKLVQDLATIGSLSGEFHMTGGVRDIYNDWYLSQDEDSPVLDNPEFSGYCERRPTHLQKLMMILSASGSSDMRIDVGHFDRALAIMSTAEQTMDRAFTSLERVSSADLIDAIGTKIQQSGSMWKKDIVKKFYKHADNRIINVALDTLLGMQAIHLVETDPRKGIKYSINRRKKDA